MIQTSPSALRSLGLLCVAALCLVIFTGNTAVPPIITVRLEIDRAEALRGESVYFKCEIENTGDAVAERAKRLTATSRALSISAVSDDETRTANEYDVIARDGEYDHGPRDAEVEPLQPHGKLNQSGDLLTWLGELPPGKYKLTARYSGSGKPVTSSSVPLHVLPVKIGAIDAPKFGYKLDSAPIAALFTVQAPEGQLVIAQHQSQALPRNPRHGNRVGTAPASARVFAGCVATPALESSCAVWSESPKRVMVGRARVTDGYVTPAVAVTPPYAGDVLASPLAMPEGRTLVPFVSSGREKAAILDVAASGAAVAVELPIASGSTVADAYFLWNGEERLDAVWTTGNARELVTARMPLKEPGATFSSPVVIGLDDPAVCMRGYLDAEGPRARTLPDAPSPAPDSMLWVVTRNKAGLSIFKVNLTLRIALPVWAIPSKQEEIPEVVSAVLNKDQELCLLLRAPSGELWYASSATRIAVPLVKVIGTSLSAAQSPQLFAATGEASRAWVFVRYIAENERVAWTKIEPTTERDPTAPRAPAPSKPVENDDDLMPRPAGAKDEH